ncbi:MAG TPA: fibro-slime domain-containing protein [Fibrobacteraceae bacterium]|nr:fibro-slime domain-containing protein [Fibrobacteraceae bacterium]
MVKTSLDNSGVWFNSRRMNPFGTFHRLISGGFVLLPLCFFSCSQVERLDVSESSSSVAIHYWSCGSNLYSWIHRFGSSFDETDDLLYDVTFFDFQPSHVDFVNYDNRWEEISSDPLAGYSAFSPQCRTEENPASEISSQVCEEGNACTGSNLLYYGDYTFPTLDPAVDTMDGTLDSVARHYRTWRHKLSTLASLAGGNVDTNWEYPVYTTQGMVKNHLCTSPEQDGCSAYALLDSSDPFSYMPQPMHPTMGCHSDHMEQWFQPVAGVNKSIQASLVFHRNAGSRHYTLVNDSASFFPLDSLSSSVSWGKQSLNLWCPPYEGGWNELGDSSEMLLCKSYLTDYGGPRGVDGNSAWSGDSLWHNSLFSMSFYSRFTYHGLDTLWFVSSSDLWVFVDHYLVLDLGGSSWPAQGMLAIAELVDSLQALGDSLSWKIGSTHEFHLFYASRHADHPQFQMTFNHPEIIDLRTGMPRILGANISQDTAWLFVNNALTDSTLSWIAENPVSLGDTNVFPLIVLRGEDTLGVAIQSIQKMDSLDFSYPVYRVVGVLCSSVNCAGSIVSPLTDSDSLAFNFYDPSEGHAFALPSNLSIATENGQVSEWCWAPLAYSHCE